VREDGAVEMARVPAGFLKITRNAVSLIMEKYPELIYGERCSPHVDLFNHGAFENAWWGEDYAFCRRWHKIGKIWCIPTLNLVHHSCDKSFAGNYDLYLRHRPGGDLSEHPLPPSDRHKTNGALA
jgi:hypothetical protein